MITNATQDQLRAAIAVINKKYNGNISLNRCTPEGNRTRFTLRAVSGEYGSRNSSSGRRMPKASWEAHGDLFDALFAIEPGIYVLSMGKRITIEAGNWQHIEVGSMMRPSVMADHSNN